MALTRDDPAGFCCQTWKAAVREVMEDHKIHVKSLSEVTYSTVGVTLSNCIGKTVATTL
jgi:hypothetical protein